MGYGIKDTPWHTEWLHSTDERREKTRCQYFVHIEKKKGFCSIKGHRCTGSSHCDEYKVRKVEAKKSLKVNKEETKKQNTEQLDQKHLNPGVFLKGKKIISPKKEVCEIIDFQNLVLYVQMSDGIHKIGVAAIKNPPIGRWSAVDDEVQTFLLSLLEKKP